MLNYPYGDANAWPSSFMATQNSSIHSSRSLRMTGYQHLLHTYQRQNQSRSSAQNQSRSQPLTVDSIVGVAEETACFAAETPNPVADPPETVDTVVDTVVDCFVWKDLFAGSAAAGSVAAGSAAAGSAAVGSAEETDSQDSEEEALGEEREEADLYRAPPADLVRPTEVAEECYL
jgi:hypothetical protein